MLFSAVWGDSKCIRRFHLETNNDEGVSVTEWDSAQRTVIFATPINVPAVVRRVIGSEVIQVVETQTTEVCSDGSILVHSAPEPQIAAASMLKTEAEFHLQPKDAGCRVGDAVPNQLRHARIGI